MYWDYDFYPRARPNPKALAGMERKNYGETWWSKKWISVLESFGWSNRLNRGKAYARAGMVKKLSIDKGVVKAKVKGSRPNPYDVTIDLKTLSKSDWNKVVKKLLSKAVFSAKLLNSEMPVNIEDIFREVKLPLFPESSRDFEMDCSCPDSANPCKHIAAVFYVVADSFDHEPFLIFKLRGMDKEDILSNLRTGKGSDNKITKKNEFDKSQDKPKSKEIIDLNKCISSYWNMGKEINSFEYSLKQATVIGAILKRLGKPKFWVSNNDFGKEMSSIYSVISNKAYEIAFGKNSKTLSKR